MAAIAAELANLPPHRPSEVSAQKQALTQDEAADQLQVSRSSVQAAKKVLDAAPDLAAKVRSGELKVSRAATIARERAKPRTDPDQAADSETRSGRGW